jgi:hypothetical protein
MTLYDTVAEKSGFIVYRHFLRHQSHQAIDAQIGPHSELLHERGWIKFCRVGLKDRDIPAMCFALSETRHPIALEPSLGACVYSP